MLMYDNGTVDVVIFSVKRGTRYLQDNVRDVQQEKGSIELLGCIYKLCLESFIAPSISSQISSYHTTYSILK
jgi:hypothetical protein